MRPRTEAALAVGALLALLVLAGIAGARQGRGSLIDGRASSYLRDPYGTRGYADALESLGVVVERWRRPLRWLDEDSTRAEPSLLVLIDPPLEPAMGEVTAILEWGGRRGRGLLLAGHGAERVIRCFGYAIDQRPDSVTVSRVSLPAGTLAAEGWPGVTGLLAGTTTSEVLDSTRVGDARVRRCQVPPLLTVAPLLEARNGRAAGLRLTRGDTGGEVLLFADATPFRNRVVRYTPAGVFVLSWVAGRYRRVLFVERSQGFGEGGSLLAATLDWSRRSPWGWAAWQAVAVGLITLAVGAVRFGQPLRLARRRRRSTLEHGRALATALAAARGHDVAIGLMVRGLRRRLGGRQGLRGEDSRDWVKRLPRAGGSARARDAQAALLSLTEPGQPSSGVLRAANAVEDLWEALHR